MSWPVASGSTWTVGQGYNTRPTEDGSHWACNPKTLRDAPTGTVACRAHYQYQFAMDLARADGNTPYQVVLAPADGSITWTEAATGGGVIDLGDGYAFGFFHLRLDPAIVAGARVARGQRLGVVAPSGEGGNGGWPHVHINLWQSNDGGNWDRNSVPFTGAYALGGVSFPDRGPTSYNQYRGTTFVSGNSPVGGNASTPTPTPAVPATPVQVSPANGVAITRQNPTATMVWRTATGANEYQIVVDDGKLSSPWLTGTTWTTPILSAGQHVWQVRARNYGGNSPLSAKWLLFVNTSGTPSSPSPTPSQAPGNPAAGLTALPVGGAVSTTISLRGGGFAGSEPVRITLDSTGGPLLGTVDATSNGSMSASVTVGEASRGTHTLIARGQMSGRQQSATYTVAPSLSRSPLNGPPGTAVTVTAHGYAANETVRLTWLTATGSVLSDLRTGANGSGSASFALPEAARGWHDYSGVGLTSGARAWGNFGIDPSLTLSVGTASPGQQIAAVARGFGGATPVTFTWNRSPASAGTVLCIITSNSTGQATCPITVPGGSGVFPVTATSPDGTTQTMSVRVGGGLSVSLSPSSGIVGSSVQVSGGGFSANETVALRWDNGAVATRVAANGSGTVSRLLTVPFLPYGGHTLSLRGEVSGRQASATFAVAQSGSLTPTGGASGSRVSVSALGLPASQSATVYWNRTSGSNGTALCSGTVSSSGTFTCAFTVPTANANTTYPVTIVAGSVSVPSSFQVSGSSGDGGPVGPPSSGNGTYVVNATREGLVGGTTSSGHVIQTLDRFVSLPACTASSCPWLAPGVAHAMWGIRTECGSACYVRIVNPANNRCVVAPIEDTGPWYTQDDYWNPTTSRFLNTLSSNPNILRQGYPGAQAARDGLDTGYGIAPSGIGISNKGYEVGNSSAIDIGDGSWVDLGYNINGASAGAVTVTMLWQSGENPTAAARSCGQSSADPPAGAGNGTGTPQPSATPRTPTATPRTPTATPRTPTATPRTPTATPRTPTATPRTPTATPRTPTPTPPSTGSIRITVSPTSVTAGDPIQLTGSGFAPRESVTIRSGSATGAIVGSVVAQSSGSFTVSIPTTTLPGGTRPFYARGGSSSRQASTTVTIRARVTVDPGSGAPGANVQVRVAGFQPSERVQIRWGSASGTLAGTVQTNSAGQGSISVRVPSGSGTRLLYATGTTVAQSVVTTFVTTAPTTVARVSASASRPTSGSGANVSATGLPTGSGATVYWDRTTPGGLAVCRGGVSSSGTFTCSFPLPSSVTANRTYQIVVVAGDSSAVGTVVFTGSAAPAPTRPPRTARLTIASGPVSADSVYETAATPVAIVMPAGAGTPVAGTTDPGTPVAEADGSAASGPTATRVPVEPAGTPVETAPPATPMAPVLEIPTATAAAIGGTPTAAPSPIDVSVTLPTPTTVSTVEPTATPPVPIAPTLTLDPTNVPTQPATVAAGPDDSPLPTEVVTPSPEGTTAPTVAVITTATIAPTAEPSDEAAATDEPANDSTPAPEATSSLEPTSESTGTGTASPNTPVTAEPSLAPTSTPAEEPTVTPTDEPTATATEEPTIGPTQAPTSTPTPETTQEPTATPTEEPTATPTEEPTATPTEEPTATPTLAPEPVIQSQTIYPIADTSLTSTAPDAAQAPEAVSGLALGGPDGAVSYLSFDVSAVAAPGSVVSATLSLTGVGDTGATGGELLALPGVVVDEYGATWTTRPTGPVSAIDAAGSPVWIDWVGPGGVASVDVTGTVSPGGVVTFVLVGQPDATTTIGSRESGAPPTLTIETLVDPGV